MVDSLGSSTYFGRIANIPQDLKEKKYCAMVLKVMLCFTIIFPIIILLGWLIEKAVRTNPQDNKNVRSDYEEKSIRSGDKNKSVRSDDENKNIRSEGEKENVGSGVKEYVKWKKKYLQDGFFVGATIANSKGRLDFERKVQEKCNEIEAGSDEEDKASQLKGFLTAIMYAAMHNQIESPVSQVPKNMNEESASWMTFLKARHCILRSQIRMLCLESSVTHEWEAIFSGIEVLSSNNITFTLSNDHVFGMIQLILKGIHDDLITLSDKSLEGVNAQNVIKILEIIVKESAKTIQRLKSLPEGQINATQEEIAALQEKVHSLQNYINKHSDNSDESYVVGSVHNFTFSPT